MKNAKKVMYMLSAAAMAVSMMPVTAMADEKPTITIGLTSDADREGFDAVVEAAEEKLGINIEVETRSAGEEGVNQLRSRIASGDIPDIVYSNAGSKLNDMNPAENFVDLNDYPEILDRIDESFTVGTTVGDAVYGIPYASSQAGCVMYNKAIYEELGLEVPTTWQEFLDNCQAAEDAGYTGLIGTFGDSWTSQVLFLGDYYNVTAKDPDFGKEFEEGKAKYATTESALRSFEKYGEVSKFYNDDYLTATYDDGCGYLAEGKGAHWIMLTQALSNIYTLYDKETVDNIGIFGVPSDDGNSGLTVWVGMALYANKNSKNLDAVMDFLNYYISDEALDIYTSKLMPYGPFSIKGYTLPDNAYEAVSKDMQAYFDNGNTHLAQEFECAVKGPNCENILVELASGGMSAEEAAETYDSDCYAQATQLGLDWDN